jgi:hypothetical protein
MRAYGRSSFTVHLGHKKSSFWFRYVYLHNTILCMLNMLFMITFYFYLPIHFTISVVMDCRLQYNCITVSHIVPRISVLVLLFTLELLY